MIVYSDRRRAADPRALAGALAGRLAAGGDATEALVDAGILEAAVADALQPDEDDDPPAARALGAATLDLAHAARGGPDAPRRRAAALARLRAPPPLPARVEVGEPEGFAFYALYPETYAEAARRFLRAARPRRALAIGLRGIGATLAAVVAAEAEAAGVPVRVLTVRPRGHPWDRALRLGPRARAALEEGAAGHVLVVDEGPGISGTSFACAAEAAGRAGTPDARIVLFPSWDADGSTLRSGRARALWPRHPRWTVPFEEAVLPRLAAAWGGEPVDLGGGLWRDRLFPGATAPAVHPHHERRKYLAPGDGGPVLLKFAGLGARGVRMLARAQAQADAGLAPEPVGLADGFLAFRLAPGRPAARADLDGALLDAMARHLAFLRATEPPAGAARFDEAAEMIRVNLSEAGLEPPAWLDGCREAVTARPAVAGDGRMMPHEWLLGPRPLKCDGLDHHDDHFWPGTQDVAWDLAGAMAEWDMDAAASERLLDSFVAATADAGVRRVLPFHSLAYLAWRLGYSTLAAETLGGEEAARIAALRDRYAARLRRVLASGAPA